MISAVKLFRIIFYMFPPPQHNLRTANIFIISINICVNYFFAIWNDWLGTQQSSGELKKVNDFK
jgi:hypothetical protein